MNDAVADAGAANDRELPSLELVEQPGGELAGFQTDLRFTITEAFPRAYFGRSPDVPIIHRRSPVWTGAVSERRPATAEGSTFSAKPAITLAQAGPLADVFINIC